MARDRRPRDDDDFDDDRPRRAPRPRPRDDDDDDFEEADRPRPRPAGSNTAVKVLAIVGVVLLGITLICSGACFLVYRSIARGVEETQQRLAQAAAESQKRAEESRKEAEKQALLDAPKREAERKKREADEAATDKAQATVAVQAFMFELKGGQTAAAYQSTTTAFQARVTEAAFEAMVKPPGVALNFNVMMVRPDHFAPSSGRSFTYEIWLVTRTAKVTAVKQDGQWRVDQFTVAAK